MARAKQDAEAAFERFFRAEYIRVKRTVYLIVRSHSVAEEVAQESFIQLLDHWKKVSRYDRPDAWVRRVAIRLAMRAMRKDQRRAWSESVFEPRHPPQDVDNDLLGAVAKLPPAQRAAIVLFYYEDLPVAEIADILDCAPSTAKVHLHKGRGKLASLLQEEVLDAL